MLGAFALSLVALSGCSESASNKSASTSSTPTTKAASSQPSAAGSQPGSASSQPASATKPQVQARVDAATERLNASEAGKKVLRAIDAHGGLEAWFSQSGLAFTYHYAPVGDDKKEKKSHQVIDVMTSRAYHSLELPAKGPFAFDGEKAWSKLEGDADFPARFWALTPYYFVGMPFVLSDPGVNLELVDHTAEAAGLENADVIAVTFDSNVGDAPEDTYHAFLDKETGALVGLRYTVTYAPFFEGKEQKRSQDKIVHYGDVKPAGPLKLARSHAFYAFDRAQAKSTKKGAGLGKKLTQATVSNVEYNAKFDESKLKMPAGAKVDDSLGK